MVELSDPIESNPISASSATTGAASGPELAPVASAFAASVSKTKSNQPRCERCNLIGQHRSRDSHQSF